MSSLIAGIDLGTTNSLIGVMDSGFPLLLAGEDGDRLTPSVVYLPPEGEAVAGAAALRMRPLHRDSVIYAIKRFMGRRVGEDAEEVDYALGGARGGPVHVRAGGRQYRPEEISAFILKKLRRDAERAMGQPVERAVITVPAYFHDAQRQATKSAGELAGLTVERIINEPTAAALAYGLDKLGEHSKIAVYDLGGGTFDLSILEMRDGVFQVLATHGNTRLGGEDLDLALIRHFAAIAHQRGGGEEGAAGSFRLREAAIAAKHRLSTEEEVEMDVPFFDGGESISVRLTRKELEALAGPLFGKTREHCARALADARLTPADLDQVILVGGQTRMPLVRELVAEIFGRTPDASRNPDEAVALGATLQAGILSGAVQNMVLLDVTPLSLGIETFGGLMNVIIPRNSTIPCKAGEMFTNAVAAQRAMRISVLQGEREMARDNWFLGAFELGFQAAAKGKARVGVQFEIDASGILHVLARDTQTGEQKEVKIESAVDVSDEAVEKMIGESLEHAFEDVNERIFVEARIKAEALLPAVRRALDRVGDALAADERALIVEKMREVQEALTAGGAQPLRAAAAALDEATQHLAVLLIEQAQASAKGE